ncbi:MAG: phosphomannomutase/phosphoglucomutase [Clostridia bacterium]|nr:phosphomannomutase/phosphoglucomutase [Clostridia bacterium]
MDKFWKNFKSGTDIRGVAVDGVEGEPLNLTDEVVGKMAKAFLLWLSGRTGRKPDGLKVAVGHDSRISAGRIRSAVVSAMTECGAKVLDCGLSSTPSMFMITLDKQLDGSVQITASHHPYHRNGLKFFTPAGGLDGCDIEAILGFCDADTFPAPAEGGSSERVDYMKEYSAHLRDIICKGINAAHYDRPLEGLHIVVDAGNGAGGFYAYDVLEPLGADISGSVYLEPDGMFPHHIPNPEDKNAMKSICGAVLRSKADLGVIFDTDVDRGGAVDSLGAEINRNRLVALASAIALENCPGGTIVTDSTTSAGLRKFIEGTLGGVHYRYRRGYRNVINRAVELNEQGIECPLAIETSGHAAMRENYFLDDGAYLVTMIIIKMAQLRAKGECLAMLTADLEEPLEESELRFKIKAEDFREYGRQVLRDLEEYAAAQENWIIADDNREGLRVSFEEEAGWFLLRLSVHDPIMPLNLESMKEGGCKAIAAKLYRFLKKCDGLDLTAIEKFIG